MQIIKGFLDLFKSKPKTSNVVLKNNFTELIQKMNTAYNGFKLNPKDRFNRIKAKSIKIDVFYRNAYIYHRQLECVVEAMRKESDVNIDQRLGVGIVTYDAWFTSDDDYMLDCIVFLQQINLLWQEYFELLNALNAKNSTMLWYYQNRSTALCTDGIIIYQSIHKVLNR
jgi:hypothetical protein